MVSRFRIKREKEYPLPHNFASGASGSLQASIFSNWPEIIHDDARIPAAIFTNPEHLSFAEYAGPNCCPDSEVTTIFTEIRFTLTTGFLQTDGLGALRVMFLPIGSAFEDQLAIDELSSVEVQDVIEMERETTDRQTFPTWSGTDLNVKFTSSTALHADVPDAAATPQETVVFDIDLYYDAINFLTIAGKLRSITKGIRWLTLTANNPTRRVLIRQTGKTKFMNPFTYKGILWGVPIAGSKYQIPMAADTTAVNHYLVEQNTRYLEWNNMFHPEKVSAP